ncbi:MAG: class I SAM-dependent RNA methyltransferase [Hyphomicrobium sp.]|nr:class I SAM-dependent RNA methyltransferase [Hyphomicrobium sp.]
MTTTDPFEIFLVTAPGLEKMLFLEARAEGFASARYVPGGVTMQGSWPDVWRANLELRGAGRVTATLGSFHVLHLSELDKRASKFPWREILRPGVPVCVDVSCKKSRIYHSGAAQERIEKAIAKEMGAAISPDAGVTIRARIENDICTIGIDTSGELLHRRGHKEAVNKAPMRETLASLFLRQCGYDGTEPVLDPMCGSGTFVIEAAEIAARLAPGRSRTFAFEQLATFDALAWSELRAAAVARATTPSVRFYGSDRDPGAIRMSEANAARAGVSDFTDFKCQAISELVPPEGPAGLVIVNPPYGDRIGEKHNLTPLYRALGQTLKSRFSGWRVGVITSGNELAHATGLPFLATTAPVAHGGLRVTLWQTEALK